MKKIIALVLAILMLIPLLCSCGTGDTVMSLGNARITTGMMTFWLSRYKAQFLYNYGPALKSLYGLSDSTLNKVWEIQYDSEAGTTYDDLFSSYIADNAMTYLCGLYLFDKFGLKLDGDTVDEIDGVLKQYIEDYADGSKSEFNTVLAEYGFNYRTLRECYLIDAKITKLQNYLFGQGGPEQITDDVMEKYYESHYSRMQQICIFINQCPEKDEKGNIVTDENGNVKYRDMTAGENQNARAKADEALAKIRAGLDFGAATEQFNENPQSSTYTNGIYLSDDSATTEDLITLNDTVKGMKIGEVKLVELEGTLHIVKKLELDKGAYKNSVNADFFYFFDSSAGEYVGFGEYLKTPLFLEYIAKKLGEMSADVKKNEKLLDTLKLSKVNANNIF